MYTTIVNLDIQNPITEFIKSHSIFPYIRLVGWDDIDSVDKSLPTLYIGYRRCQEAFKALDIGVNTLSPTERWAFTPEESTIYFIEQCTSFLKDIPQMLVQGLVPVAIEPFFNPLTRTAKEALQAVLDFQPQVCYTYDNVFSFSRQDTKNILLVNTNIWQAFGLNAELLQFVVSEETEARIVADDQDERVRCFFVDEFEFPPSGVTLYAPYLIQLKNKALKLAKINPRPYLLLKEPSL